MADTSSSLADLIEVAAVDTNLSDWDPSVLADWPNITPAAVSPAESAATFLDGAH